jgi:hypothetical protein
MLDEFVDSSEEGASEGYEASSAYDSACGDNDADSTSVITTLLVIRDQKRLVYVQPLGLGLTNLGKATSQRSICVGQLIQHIEEGGKNKKDIETLSRASSTLLSILNTLFPSGYYLCLSLPLFAVILL